MQRRALGGLLWGGRFKRKSDKQKMAQIFEVPTGVED